MPDTPEKPALPTRDLVAFTPVPRAKDRSNGWKPEVQRAFIEALADYGSVKAACRAVGRADHGAYQLRRHPEAGEFAAAWEAALDHGVRKIEDVAMDRALNGVEVPVYAYSKIIGTRTVYNDRLLMFMLRNRAPERFCADGARGLNAVGKMQVERLKKQWHAEWLAKDQEDVEEVRASLDRFIGGIRTMRRAHMSPAVRAAWDEYRRLEAEEYSANPHLYDDDQGDGDETDTAIDVTAMSPPDEPATSADESPKRCGPRIRTLKDEGWR